MSAPDIGASHYNVFRVHRAMRRTKTTLKVIGGILLGLLALIAFIVHEYERANRHRLRHH